MREKSSHSLLQHSQPALARAAMGQRLRALALLAFLGLLGAASPALMAQTAAPPANEGANAITQAVVQKGIMNCASRINQVTNFLGYSAAAGAMLMPPANQVDQRLVPLALELPLETGSAYVSVTFAPNQANGCGAAYDAVVYWPQACELVASQQFKTFSKGPALRKNITVLDGGAATKVFLMPAGSGCVSIKKEVVL